MNKVIKVLIVDDSALIRRLLSDILRQDEEIEVVGVAKDAFDAREKIKKLNPDVITLDIEMPKMDGIDFLEKLMRLHPMPVVMISTLTERSAEATMKALQLGAVDFLHKPRQDVENTLHDYSYELIRKVKIASYSKVARLADANNETSNESMNDNAIEQLNCHSKIQMVAIGSSTGGTEALSTVLKTVPKDFPPIVIAQHIPPKFSKAFANRLNNTCQVTVHEASDGQKIETGNVYIAPGGYQLEVVKNTVGYKCRVFDGVRVNRHAPSVEVMFKSVADQVGKYVISVMLTGMGKDGAESMKELHDLGVKTIAQDEKTSVVWGMPGAAVSLGCVDKVLPLENITSEMLNMCREENVRSASSITKVAS